MKQTLAIAHQPLVALLLMTIGLGASGCGDSASINPEVELASLTVTPGALQPTFASTTTRYNVDVSTSVTSVTITAQPRVAGDTVTIDGQPTTSRSIPVGQAGGPPTIVSIVVSESTTKSRTYTVVLNKVPLAGNNDLSQLLVIPAGLSPAFAPSEQDYTLDVATDITSVIVAATKSDPNAVISGGDVPNNGQASIPLDGPGTTKNVLITVTAQNGNAKTYRISIKRAAPMDNNNLSGLTVNAGTLDPAFAAGIQIYTVNVASGVDRITVSATKSDPQAVMSAFGSVIAAAGVPTGQTSASLGLNTTTPILITVRAPNGNPKTYTVNVFRPNR